MGYFSDPSCCEPDEGTGDELVAPRTRAAERAARAARQDALVGLPRLSQPSRLAP